MRLFTGLLVLVSFGCEVKIPRISTEGIESIDVRVYRNKELIGVDEDFTLTVPKDDWDSILNVTLPHKWAEVGRDQLKMGTVTVKYQDNDKSPTSIAFFFSGKNPCMVSLDGKRFYYAKGIPGSPVGSMELMRRIFAIRKAASNEKKEER